MLEKVVLLSVLCFIKITWVLGHCVDIHSQIISQGLHYVPGPNSCTLCICDKGGPKWCKSVLCSQPQNCKSFQRGNSCCEFKCLDDILTANDTYKDTYDLALRFIASAVFIILTLSLLFFVVHRFRRHKLRVQQTRQLNEDQRSLNSIGYITGSLGYLPGNLGYLGSGTNDLEFHYEDSNGHFSLWKPPGNYFPRGEAPPPYEEAIRSTQIDTNNTQVLVTTTSTELSAPVHQVRSTQQTPNHVQCRHQHLTNRTNINQEYANVTVETVSMQHLEPVVKIGKTAQPEICGNRSTAGHRANKNSTNTERSKSYENIVLNKRNDKPVANSERKTIRHKSQIFPDSDKSNVDKNNVKFHKYENIVLRNIGRDGHIRKIEHPSVENCNNAEVCYENINPSYENSRHRSIPLHIDYHNKPMSRLRESKSKDSVCILAENNLKREFNKIEFGEKSENHLKSKTPYRESKEPPLHRTLPKNIKELTVSVSSNNEFLPSDVFKRFETDNFLHRSLPKQLSNHDTILSVNLVKSQISLTENLAKDLSPSIAIEMDSASTSMGGHSDAKQEDRTKSKEDERTFISYQCLSSSQDEDDYRSECENCKLSEVINVEDEEGDVFNETMTLQRRPEASEEVPYYRTSLTLPTQIKKPRAVTPNPGWNGWFMAMQETSSSEESE